MKLNFKLVLAALSLTLMAKSQNTSTETRSITKRGCGTAVPAPEWDAWFNKKVAEYKDNKVAGKTSQNVSMTIPVVVHVIHGGNSVGVYPNISQAQIRSQIDVLNKDFAGNGKNSNKLANTGFASVGAANTNITFCLAQLDPDGNVLAEPGIDRRNFNTAGWGNPNVPNTTPAFQSYFNGTVKPNTIWDPTRYYNIWVSDVNPGAELLGYATYPGGASLNGITSNFGSASDDGIWVWARSFGTVGTLQSPYNFGRTASHETGHWLGLRHIGGDGNGNPNGDCTASDFCDDTPPQTGGYSGGSFGQNFGNPTYPLHVNVCSSPFGDMFMNFMDYTDDAINYMFTPDQNDRMQTAMLTGYFRIDLPVSSTTLCVGLPIADFFVNGNQTNLSCANEFMPITNLTNTDPETTTYLWTVKPSTGVVFSPSDTDANPSINLPSTTTAYTVTMVASNSVGVTSSTVELHAENCTGIKENDLGKAISLAPNPSSGKINISAGVSAGKDLQVYVHNALGQLVAFKEYSNNGGPALVIDLTSAPDGVYTVSITNGTEKTVKRLILTK